jgi:hypothetical protein
LAIENLSVSPSASLGGWFEIILASDSNPGRW